ncbi:hypothetical protein X943_003520 [Babesia divergens]|uniref:Uncharacterized protein n=1 Tax=Babesia divergens TaxID=32595 RepID=A0AAD9G7V0_BABDI|nr:hypothetical protein X943_003520 [Babesia divergens]
MSSSLVYYMKYATGVMAFLSVVLPYYINFAVYSPALFRPILNVSWAFIFGTHLWYLFLSSDDFYVTGGDEGNFFRKKRDLLLTDSADECTKFFVSTLFFNSLIVITTHGLAPYYKRIQYCSIASLVSTFVNTFFVPKDVESHAEGAVFTYVSPATCSRILSLLTCLPLTIYGLL